MIFLLVLAVHNHSNHGQFPLQIESFDGDRREELPAGQVTSVFGQHRFSVARLRGGRWVLQRVNPGSWLACPARLDTKQCPFAGFAGALGPLDRPWQQETGPEKG